jgi:molybdenum cofactor biosynthesis enzyme MoaA
MQAQGYLGEIVRVIAVEPDMRLLWCAETGQWLDEATICEGLVSVVMNASFLLGDPPQIMALTRAVEMGITAVCAVDEQGDYHAFACKSETLTGAFLWSVLRALTCRVGEEFKADRTRLGGIPRFSPATSGVVNSPAMVGIENCRGLRTFDAPPYINTALSEIMSAPADLDMVDGRPERMADVLAAQGRVSRVPWIFNTLLNEIEYRLGQIEPQSFPPEMHLSVTGVCNIECKFCTYEHAIARKDFVDVARLARLEFLQNVQSFRLHSGLGEPTANPHLPRLIEHIAERFPHVGMNFFTNAVALRRPGLIEALIGKVHWINASLNAATRESWQNVCGADLFERVVGNLKSLHRAKQAARTYLPLVFGSMVLTRANIDDLPGMPALCRSLGIDRFTVFPYFGLGYHVNGKYGSEMTLAACRKEYDELYWETVREAELHGVSLEIPLPSDSRRIAFGVEARILHDFARIEVNQWKLGRFVYHLNYTVPPGKYCHFLWRSAGIGSTNRRNTGEGTHYLYPCIGPLSSLDLSKRTAFQFSDSREFVRLWQSPVFSLLRRAQHVEKLSPVCDVCRNADTRDPRIFASLERLVAEFAREQC